MKYIYRKIVTQSLQFVTPLWRVINPLHPHPIYLLNPMCSCIKTIFSSCHFWFFCHFIHFQLLSIYFISTLHNYQLHFLPVTSVLYPLWLLCQNKTQETPSWHITTFRIQLHLQIIHVIPVLHPTFSYFLSAILVISDFICLFLLIFSPYHICYSVPAEH